MKTGMFIPLEFYEISSTGLQVKQILEVKAVKGHPGIPQK